ncbi:GIY-YIG nuclease family protein [Polyangium sp. y55x31]|uniref:GIY-YIG nuclease family protein n=1 Tax=Polyangium sp. y55x31 TaxID=3042688 RepID=UPI0024826129|nr:GIY-YIG nuclease family protein [Polyangium sp. y55x31]MDI1484463.1 GIY-YIG nuclease family protein [Polyangium sp. y55x31]
MTHGKSVRIFLADGVPTGIRHAEIVNWTGQAIACPRARFSELQHWAEVSRPGVYFLLSRPTGSSAGTTYIGEAENVLVRLKAHLREKEFWNELVVFSSKDENLTKSHVKFLEARLIQQANAARRFQVENVDGSSVPTLPRADLAAMEEYLEYLRLVLGTLGYPVLEPIEDTSSGATKDPRATPPPMSVVLLSMSGKSYNARGRLVDEGFLLLEGSEVAVTPGASMPGAVRELWETAKATGDLASNGTTTVLKKNMLFSSPSYAASFVTGQSRNGRKDWKAQDGRTLGEVEDAVAMATA